MYDENSFKRYVINFYGDLPKLLENIDVYVKANNMLMCPFHDNYNTEAAKLFRDNNGWFIFCFSERRQFGTYDIYKDILQQNTNLIFNQLWANLSQEQREQMQDTFGEFDDSTEIKGIQFYQAFKRGHLSYRELLSHIE